MIRKESDTLHRYSPVFETLHDELRPTGRLDRETHYSVLRCATWHTPSLERRTEGAFQDFAIVWDEDHDPRIVNVLENLYFAGLLGPVLFAGEHKGALTLWLDDQTPMARNLAAYKALVMEHACVDGDAWTCEVFAIARPEGLTMDPFQRYREFVRELWSLGHHPRDRNQA